MTFLTQIRKIRNFLVTSLLAAVLGGLFFVPPHVWASTYGSGNYGNCTYSATNSSNSDCPSSNNILLNDFSEYFSSTGKQLVVSVGQVIYFDVTTNGQTQHKSITIKAIASDHVDITITLDSTNLNDRINVGQTKSYDVNGDGKDDIWITVNSVNGNKATMTFRGVLGTETSNTNKAAVLPGTKGAAWWIWMLASLALIILGIIIFIILKRRRKKDDDDQFRPPTPPPLPPESTITPQSPPSSSNSQSNSATITTSMEPTLPMTPLPSTPPIDQSPPQPKTLTEIQDLHLSQSPTLPKRPGQLQ
ncbi:MAG TPA: hypothetical protein VLF39_04635 [Candidatus Saccharimonadales bacterium]|nr:hypothetical protein [Candidatus Saccharimonadales bacterium]